MVHQLGFPTCFLSMDKYIGNFTPALATQYRGLLDKYELTATTIEVVGPPPLVWNFTQGPDTIGIVPPKYRAARIDALRRPGISPSCSGIPRCKPIAALFLRTRATRSIRKPWKPSARSQNTARAMARRS